MVGFTIDRQNKTYVFEDGEVIPIPKEDQKQILRTPTGEKAKTNTMQGLSKLKDSSILDFLKGTSLEPVRDIAHSAGEKFETFSDSLSKSFFGNPGSKVVDYAMSAGSSITPGEGQEGLSFIDRLLDNYYARQEGRSEFLKGQQERDPISAVLGQGIGIAGELATTGGIPAAVALPAMGMAHNESSFLEPSEYLGEASGEAVIGLLLDKFLKGASTVAGHRGTIRDTLKKTEEAALKNEAELARVSSLNDAERARFNMDNAAREARLRTLPEQRATAQNQFSNNIVDEVRQVEKALGKRSISNTVLGVENFIKDKIETTALATSKEGNEASKFLRSVFKGSEGRIVGSDITKGFEALEKKIATSSGELQNILVDFKNHAADFIPQKIGHVVAFEEFAPKIQSGLSKSVENEFLRAFKNDPVVLDVVESRFGNNFIQSIAKDIEKDIQKLFNSNADRFLEFARSDVLTNELATLIENNPKFQSVLKVLEKRANPVGKYKNLEYAEIESYKKLESELLGLPEKISNKLAKKADRYSPDMALQESKLRLNSEGPLSNARGMAPTIPEPPPLQPFKETMPNPTNAPTPFAPQDSLQKLALSLENLNLKQPMEALKDIKTSVPGAIGAKMLGLPLAKSGALLASGGAAAKAITSPGAFGNTLRSGIKGGVLMGSLAANYDSMASQYPSYQNGVLQDPMERRSLVKQIEDDPEMSLEDKAMLQTKVNRGIPLSR